MKQGLELSGHPVVEHNGELIQRLPPVTHRRVHFFEMFLNAR